ncbi:MAG: hypothetical protein SLRJCFUN_000891 [Candidatus Fervidibacter sp.]
MRNGFAVWLAVGVVFSLSSSAMMPVPQARRLIVVVCDGLTFPMLERMGEPIPKLLRHSAIGLLSGTSASLQGRQGVYVTLGSGRRQSASERASLAAWLRRHRKTVQTFGDGLLFAILGTTAKEPVQQRGQNADVLFVAASPGTLRQTLRRLMATMPADTCLWLLVPNSPQTGWSTRRLTPIVLFGKSVPTGLLVSSTTRRAGLVSSVDFAPTLFTQLGIPIPPEVTGAPMHLMPMDSERALAMLRWLDERSLRPLRNLSAYVVVIVAVIALALVTTFLTVLHPTLFFRSVQSGIVVGGMSIPLALFLVAQLPFVGVSAAMALSAFILLIAVVAFFRTLHNPMLAWQLAGWLCSASALMALLGLPLYWATPLGHYPTTGWRYFGITNSGIGIVLAGTIFAWRLLPLPRKLVVVWCLAAPLLMGSSLWGANFGGALTLATGLAAAWEWLATDQPSWRRGLGRMALAFLAVVFVLSLSESWLPADQRAHYGQLLWRMQTVGVEALTEMVGRKLWLLWTFTTAMPLNFVLLTAFATFTVGVPLLARRFAVFKELLPAFLATFIGAWAGFCLNDSGIEVIGMALVYVGGVFLLALPQCYPFSDG